jgi:hypothetical protein
MSGHVAGDAFGSELCAGWVLVLQLQIGETEGAGAFRLLKNQQIYAAFRPGPLQNSRISSIYNWSISAFPGRV